MTIETLKCVIKSKFLSVSSMDILLAILEVTDARRDVILADGRYHRFPWRHLPPPPSPPPGAPNTLTIVHSLTEVNA